MVFSEMIRQYRIAHRLTQKQLAEMLGVTAAAVSKWEKNSSAPDISMLIPLAELLEVSMSDLVNALDFHFNSEHLKKEMDWRSYICGLLEQMSDGFFNIDFRHGWRILYKSRGTGRYFPAADYRCLTEAQMIGLNRTGVLRLSADIPGGRRELSLRKIPGVSPYDFFAVIRDETETIRLRESESLERMFRFAMTEDAALEMCFDVETGLRIPLTGERTPADLAGVRTLQEFFPILIRKMHRDDAAVIASRAGFFLPPDQFFTEGHREGFLCRICDGEDPERYSWYRFSYAYYCNRESGARLVGILAYPYPPDAELKPVATTNLSCDQQPLTPAESGGAPAERGDVPDGGENGEQEMPRKADLPQAGSGDGADRRVFIRTFGWFDVFVGGAPVLFPNRKAKELLALCVDRKGGYVSSAEAVASLWENEPVTKVTLARLRKTVMQLKRTLRAAGIEEIFENERGKKRVVPERVRCDLFEYAAGGRKRGELFLGSYMLNYSWGETTCAELLRL